MTVVSARFLIHALILLVLPWVEPAAADCGKPATPIARIQGAGDQSPMAGQTVSVEGILTLDSRAEGGFRGFYLQQADHQADDSPLTSEALFIYTNRQPGKPGDRLRLTGTVKEYHGLTELTKISTLIVCGRETLPQPIPLSLPWQDNPETRENMRVEFRQPLTIIDNYDLARYGELTLAAGDQVIATEYRSPSRPTKLVSRQQSRQRVLLDDGKGEQNPMPVPWPPGGLVPERTVRAGDTVTGLAGVLDFRYGDWRVQPEASPDFTSANPRLPPPPLPSGNHIRVLSMNMQNYFNGNGDGKGFPTSRGATTQADFKEQHRRVVNALLTPDPDILALTEIENDGYGPNSAVGSLAEALGPDWRVVATPGLDGSDQIRTVLLYRNDRIMTIGKPARLTSGPFRIHGRPPVVQAFQRHGSRASVRIVALHLKSKSCRGATGANLDQGIGEGCYAQRRSEAALAIADWLKTVAATKTLAGTLITGDFNSYTRENTLEVFRNAGFTSMVHRFHPCDAGSCPHYTYRYKGEKGSLDYALASDSLKPHILSAHTWLINADEPRAMGYQSLLNPVEPLPWRSSDHNPVITDIGL
ncbi:endonuclease [Marinobacter salinus]|uniref:Endonuclease n=1 Tax=Marinobacter salinus TaxID=1874317 RepID=A0A1D9GNW9_9GAMM|nr:ExeM/NucH family extracellular endonuclease [Marinobacter salinus]AOY89333.1 endonuclease [Marinobacter salinus]